MHYDILHDVPGRLRIHCRHLRLSPESSLELNRWLSEHECLLSASLSTRTGNLLLVYSRDVPRETVIVLLDELQLFGVATVGRSDRDRDRAAPPPAPVSACSMEILKAVVKPLLPGPIQRLMECWQIARRLYGMAKLASRGDLATLCRGVAKFVFLAICGQPLPLRLFFIVVGAILKQDVELTPPAGDSPATRTEYRSEYMLPVPDSAAI